MTESNPSFSENPQNPAVKADGFIDYYELIHEEPHATITRLRSTINDLYNEAQANRDHRNLNKRRSYQQMLDLLPQAREFLLDEDNRHQYNIYRDESLDGVAKQSFEEWKAATLKREGEEEDNTVLGVQEEQQRLRGQEVRAQVLKVPKDKQPTSRVAVDNEKDKISTVSSSSQLGMAATACIFFAVLIIAKVLFHSSLPKAILIAGILGIIVWLAARFANNGRTAV
jgi:multidrug efflux pump subunit AcrB